MPLIPSTTNEKPSNSETNVEGMDTKEMTARIERAMESAGDSNKGSSATEETKRGVGQAASEVERAANKLYEENIVCLGPSSRIDEELT